MLGSVDRPFAGPGDVLTVRLSEACDGVSPGFRRRAADHVATFAFKPPSGSISLVFLAEDCSRITPRAAACERSGAVESATCLAIPGLFAFPRTGEARALQFPLPDTDAVLAPDGDRRSLTGPIAIAVTGIDDPLPCDLASRDCSGLVGAAACVDRLFATTGTCDLFPHETFGHFTALPAANDFRALCTTVESECTGAEDEVRMTVDADGNLFLPMDWSGVLLGERVPFARQLRAATTVEAFPGTGDPIRLPGNSFLASFSLEGGVLPAFFEPKLDAESETGLTLFGAVDAARTVLRIERRSPARTSCYRGANDSFPCSSGLHCPGGSCEAGTCGGEGASECRSDDDCAGECGPALFDFSTRLYEGVGPILISRFGPGVCEDGSGTCETDADCSDSRCVSYRLSTEDPVLIDGLLESASLRATVVPEGIAAADLNGDGDRGDEVLLLSDRTSGAPIPIGIETTGGRAAGRAATLIRNGPFREPAVVLEGDLAAFLEAEPQQWQADHNGDGDRFDVFLRVFRRGQELTPSAPLVGDGAPLINGKAIALQRGRVFFRAAEVASARREILRISSSSGGAAANGRSQSPHLTRDGSTVAFQSNAADLMDAPDDGRDHIYFYDLRSDSMHRARIEYGDVVDPDAAAETPWFSGDGRFLAFAARDQRGLSQVWLHDRDADANGIFDEVDNIGTVLASPEVFSGGPASGDTLYPTVDLHGAVLTFASRAWDIRLSGDDRVFLTYWRDRDTNGDFVFDEQRFQSTNLVSERFGAEPGLHSVLQPAPTSDNGRYTAYASYADDIVDGDTNELCLNFFPDDQSSSNCADVFLQDYIQGRTRRISVGNRGQQGNQASLTPALSSDGRYVAFFSFASNLVAGDTNGTSDVFLRDTLRDTTARLSVSSSGVEGNGPSYDQSLTISADSRYVAFTSTAGNLAFGDDNHLCDNDLDGNAGENCRDIFLHDRFTGFTERISVTAGGGDANGPSSHPVPVRRRDFLGFSKPCIQSRSGRHQRSVRNRLRRRRRRQLHRYLPRPPQSGRRGASRPQRRRRPRRHRPARLRQRHRNRANPLPGRSDHRTRRPGGLPATGIRRTGAGLSGRRRAAGRRRLERRRRHR